MNDAALSFHPLSFVAERDEVVVGRPDIDSYVVLPADGAAALHRMTQGLTPVQTAQWYQAQYGDPLDIDDFLDTLRDLEFIREEHEPATAEPEPVHWQRLGRAFFSLPAFTGYAVLFALWLVVVAEHPQFAPHPAQVFFTSSVVIVELIAIVGQIPLLFAHEAFHALAGRRLGLPSRLGVSTRLYFVVFETRMNGLLSVRPGKRYLCFMAGILLDAIVVCALELVSYVLRGESGAVGLLGRLASALAFPVVTRLCYQFVLFLQTDIYYVLATALGCHDLHAVSRALVGNRVWPLLGRVDRVVVDTDWTDRDRHVAKWYAPLLAVGGCVLIGVWVLALVPIGTQLARLLVDGFGLGTDDPRFWDRCGFVALNLAQLALLVTVSRRGRATRTEQSGNSPAGNSPAGNGVARAPLEESELL